MNLALKNALQRRGIRQYAAASAVHITETRLSRIVCGRLEPTAHERRALAELLDMPECELFSSPTDIT